jgi:hypothetical protein
MASGGGTEGEEGPGCPGSAWVTQAPSGSFTVHLRTKGVSGTDRFRARASNVKSGETCLGRASI